MRLKLKSFLNLKSFVRNQFLKLYCQAPNVPHEKLIEVGQTHTLPEFTIKQKNTEYGGKMSVTGWTEPTRLV